MKKLPISTHLILLSLAVSPFSHGAVFSTEFETLTPATSINGQDGWLAQPAWIGSSLGASSFINTDVGDFIRAQNTTVTGDNAINSVIEVTAEFRATGIFAESPSITQDFQEGIFLVGFSGQTTIANPSVVAGFGLAYERDTQNLVFGRPGQTVTIGDPANFTSHTWALSVSLTRTAIDSYSFIASIDSLDDSDGAFILNGTTGALPTLTTDVAGVIQSLPSADGTTGSFEGIQVNSYTVETSTVPEPTVSLLSVLGIFALFRRRR